MAAITAWGSYIPLWRLRREDVGAAWGGRMAGETSVMALDEDEITMGIEAAFQCLKRSKNKIVPI